MSGFNMPIVLVLGQKAFSPEARAAALEARRAKSKGESGGNSEGGPKGVLDSPRKGPGSERTGAAAKVSAVRAKVLEDHEKGTTSSILKQAGLTRLSGINVRSGGYNPLDPEATSVVEHEKYGVGQVASSGGRVRVGFMRTAPAGEDAVTDNSTMLGYSGSGASVEEAMRNLKLNSKDKSLFKKELTYVIQGGVKYRTGGGKKSVSSASDAKRGDVIDSKQRNFGEDR